MSALRGSTLVGDAEVAAALEPALTRRFRSPVRVSQLDRQPSPYAGSALLEELVVATDHGSLVLMLKCLSRAAVTPAARHAKA